MRCRGTVRVAFLHEINHSRAQFHWMGVAHVCLPVMLTNTESQISKIGNPESHQREHALDTKNQIIIMMSSNFSDRPINEPSI